MPFHIGPFLKLPLAFWFLITLLVLSSGPAYAEWVLVSGGISDQVKMSVYTDPDTIRRKGDLVKMWHLYDFKTMMSGSFLSFKAQREYDCTEERSRTLATTYFSGNMGTGKMVGTNSDETKWIPDSPGSVGEGLWNAACIKK